MFSHIVYFVLLAFHFFSLCCCSRLNHYNVNFQCRVSMCQCSQMKGISLVCHFCVWYSKQGSCIPLHCSTLNLALNNCHHPISFCWSSMSRIQNDGWCKRFRIYNSSSVSSWYNHARQIFARNWCKSGAVYLSAQIFQMPLRMMNGATEFGEVQDTSTAKHGLVFHLDDCNANISVSLNLVCSESLLRSRWEDYQASILNIKSCLDMFLQCHPMGVPIYYCYCFISPIAGFHHYNSHDLNAVWYREVIVPETDVHFRTMYPNWYVAAIASALALSCANNCR